MSAGAVASLGTIRMSGPNSSANRNMVAVTTLANPVLAPASTPAADSISAVSAGTPTRVPTVAADESTTNGPLIPGMFPFSSSHPASAPTASVVPMVEKNSAAKNANRYGKYAG